MYEGPIQQFEVAGKIAENSMSMIYYVTGAQAQALGKKAREFEQITRGANIVFDSPEAEQNFMQEAYSRCPDLQPTYSWRCLGVTDMKDVDKDCPIVGLNNGIVVIGDISDETKTAMHKMRKEQHVMKIEDIDGIASTIIESRQSATVRRAGTLVIGG